MKREQPTVMPLVIMAGLAYLAFGKGCDLPVDPVPSNVTDVTWVYDKDENGAEPREVFLARTILNNTTDIDAEQFEVSTVDADGNTPERHRAAKAEAERDGLPALVIEADGKVLMSIRHENPDNWDADEIVKDVTE